MAARRGCPTHARRRADAAGRRPIRREDPALGAPHRPAHRCARHPRARAERRRKDRTCGQGQAVPSEELAANPMAHQREKTGLSHAPFKVRGDVPAPDHPASPRVLREPGRQERADGRIVSTALLLAMVAARSARRRHRSALPSIRGIVARPDWVWRGHRLTAPSQRAFASPSHAHRQQQTGERVRRLPRSRLAWLTCRARVRRGVVLAVRGGSSIAGRSPRR